MTRLIHAYLLLNLHTPRAKKIAPQSSIIPTVSSTSCIAAALIDWSNDEVWAYIRHYDVPYNQLHDQFYPSIGCAPCTRAVAVGEDIRAGRWWWENPESKECGLHVKKKTA